MTTNLDVKKIEIKFPERILSKYYFEGHDLKSGTIKPQILLEAIEYYILEVVTRKPKKNKNTKGIEEYNKKMLELITAKEQVRLLIKSEIEKKENFFIRSNTGEKIEINYFDSWENKSFNNFYSRGNKDLHFNQNALVVAISDLFPKIYTKVSLYMRLRFTRNNIRRIIKSSNYKKYQSEMDVKEKKILAYKVLNETSNIWADKQMVEIIAEKLNIEIVKASDFESECFTKMKL